MLIHVGHDGLSCTAAITTALLYRTSTCWYSSHTDESAASFSLPTSRLLATTHMHHHKRLPNMKWQANGFTHKEITFMNRYETYTWLPPSGNRRSFVRYRNIHESSGMATSGVSVSGDKSACPYFVDHPHARFLASLPSIRTDDHHAP